MKFYPKLKFLLLLTSIIILNGCSDDDEVSNPTVTSITPLTGELGTVVTINGTNFPTNKSNVAVFVGEDQMLTESVSVNKIEFQIIQPVETGLISVKVFGSDLTIETGQEFEVTAGEWTEKSALNIPIDIYDMSFMIDGNVYIHTTYNGVDNATFWKYNSDQDTWSELPPYDTQLRSHYSYTWGTKDKGYIYFIESDSKNHLLEYDPITNEWNVEGAVIFDSPLLPEFSFYISSLDKAFFIYPDGSIRSYNPTTRSWGTETDFPLNEVSANNRNLASSDDKNGYIILNSGDIWKYSSDSDTWVQLENPLDYTATKRAEIIYTLNGNVYLGLSEALYYFKDNEWFRKRDIPADRFWSLAISDGSNAYWGYGLNDRDPNNIFAVNDWYEFVD
ncbi:IPT/TIG domain-containing protein [Fulvivirga lutea]|uniref:IPT/TIG domain-containing protein n=1 Tax=Fulvivirga lutea TaxID=2810512 RepID=A0A974ZZV0_9BACT|nr:IPT/TIG domain-containing protein [Fulvivirga lutea]QSE96161.1 IPT/TIG domain-containing protein [Fulvivirga lutea]